MTATALGIRRLRIPTIDARVVTGIVLVAVSVVGGIRLTQAPEPGTPVFVAAADLDAGHVVTRGDLTTVEVRAADGVIAGLERADRDAPVGRVLRTPVRTGAAIPIDALGGAVPAGRDVTIPVTPDHALGGAIRPGDRVDVYATFDKGTDVARTLTVARGATIRGITESDGLFGQREGAISAITLAVDPDAAIGVAFAARNGELDVVRARGTLDGRGRERFDADTLR
jgi:Flp pilus assembly protein CpaB